MVHEQGMPAFTLLSNVGGLVLWSWDCPECRKTHQTSDVMTTYFGVAHPTTPAEVTCPPCGIRYTSRPDLTFETKLEARHPDG